MKLLALLILTISTLTAKQFNSMEALDGDHTLVCETKEDLIEIKEASLYHMDLKILKMFSVNRCLVVNNLDLIRSSRSSLNE